MNEPSEEQQTIINNIKNGYNVVVEAVAGSGKSTTILSLAKQFPEKEILQLTYNSSLRLDVREQVQNLELLNLQVHTFHSLAVKYYCKNAHTDTGIRNVLYEKKQPLSHTKIDILVIDENQDTSELYFQFVLKFLLDMKQYIQIILLGDQRQCIYQFKGADSRYLTKGSVLWSEFIYLKSNDFIHNSLKTSYRITNTMGDFVNDCLIGENIMNTCKTGEPVIYMRNNRINTEKMILFQIKKLIQNGVRPDEIFILAASIKSVHGNIRKIENKLVEENIPCYVPIFDTEKLDERVTEGKIVFSTFHSVKGRQRNYVFIIGFDNSYFQYARTLPKDVCPNTIYVGTTRAKKQLFLVEYDQFLRDRPFEFLKKDHHDMIACKYVDFKGIPRSLFDDETCENEMFHEKRYESASKIIQFISEEVLNEITPLLNELFIVKQQPGFEIDIPSVVKTDFGFEDVGDLNSIVIPCLFYEKMAQNNILNRLLDKAIGELNHEHEFLKSTFEQIPEQCQSMNDYLFMANVLMSVQQRLYFKLKQIKREHYNWLDYDVVKNCMTRLENHIVLDDTMEFEKQMIHPSMEEQHSKIDEILRPVLHHITIRFDCSVDIFSPRALWEVKCSNTISIEHKIQLVLYSWLCELMGFPKEEYNIFNIKTGEHLALVMDFEKVNKIIVAILKGKYEEPVTKTDEDFMNSNLHFIRSECIQHILNEANDFLEN